MNANLLIVGLLLGAQVQGEAGAEKDVRQALIKLNEAFGKGDADTIKAMLTEDHVAVLAVGIRQTRADALRQPADPKYTAYQTLDLKVTLLSEDVALLTFRAKVKGTYRGAPYPEDNLCSAIWVRRSGRWLERYYQETPVSKE